MKIKPWLAGTALFLIPTLSQAEEAVTVPEGYMTLKIAAGSATVPAVSTFSLPLREHVPGSFVGQSSGKITDLTATTLSNNNGGWANGALSQPASPYFVRITSGAAEGRTLQVSTSVANTASTLTVLNHGTDLTAIGIVVGADTYEIFPGDTLNSFFGTSTLGGTASSTSDVVRIHDGLAWNEYFFNTSVGQWRKGSVPVNQNNVVLRPDAGIIFYRRGTTPLAYILTGVVPNTDIRVVVNKTGVTCIGGVFPVNQTLGGSNFNSLTGWVNNTGSVTNSDKVTIWDGLSFNSYNYTQAASQWRKGSVPVNQNNVAIPAGVPVIIERPNFNSGAVTLLKPLPYSLD